MPQPAKGKPRHSAFTNLIFNILVPTLILTKFSDEGSLGPQLSIVIALAFPLSFGTWDFIQTRRANVFSILPHWRSERSCVFSRIPDRTQLL